ncbi:MAG: GAF domain-containing protein [Chloroflexota bacterium]|nr:GAF domain-containing protein [Chloroflexota bacterium]
MFKAKAQDTNRRSSLKWSIAFKLTAASVLMIILTLLAGGSGLWQVVVIGQAISDTREKEQQLALSLELLASGHRLVAAMDHMLLTEDPLLASTDVAVSLGNLNFYMETLQESGKEMEASDILEEMQVAYDELYQAVSEMDVLARQERWAEASTVMKQNIRPANERMALPIRRLVSRTSRDAEALASRAQLVIRQATLLLAVLMVLTTAIAWGWRQFVFQELSQSISELRQGVARISSGDLEYELHVRTGDEIEELSDEFNKMATDLADMIGGLEQRVTKRTRGLRTAAEVAQAATAVLDPDELLRQTVNLVRERFGLYYVGLFLLDEEEEGRSAVLRAGTGEAGQEMLARGHKLEMGGESMIGQCVARAEARIALDVGDEAVRFDNPLLPNTRSELALPLRSRGRVVGAMTVQSVEEAAFDEAYIAILQTMADQVAVAIDNARLFTDAQAALEEMEATHRHYLTQAWTEYARTAKQTHYETGDPDAAHLSNAVLPEIQQALEGQNTTVLTGDGAKGKYHSALVTPIALRGVTIGALDIHDDDGRRQWTNDEIGLVEAVAERMALAADNLRLFEETQRSLGEMEALYRAAQIISAEFDMEALTQKLVDEARRLVGADYGVLVALDPATGGIEHFRTSGIEQGRYPLTQIPQGKGVLALLLEGQTVRVNNIREHPSYGDTLPLGHLPIVSFLGMPLLYQNQVRGFLAVSNRGTGPTFDQANENLLGTFTAQATVTLESARLFQETQRSLRETESLYRASQAIGAATSVEGVGQALVNYASISGVDAVRILLFEHDEQGQPSYMVMCEGWTVDNRPAQPYGTRLPMEDYPLADLMSPNEPIIAEDVIADPRANEATRVLIQAISGLRSFIMVPITVGERWFGMVFAGRNEPSAFAEELVRGYETLTSQAAVALESLRLLGETQRRAARERLIGEITARMRASLDMESVLKTAADEMYQALGLDKVAIRLITEEMADEAAFENPTTSSGERRTQWEEAR